MIKAVIFDLDDTLCDYAGAKRKGLAAAAGAIAAPDQSLEEFVGRYFAAEPELFRSFADGQITLDVYRHRRFSEAAGRPLTDMELSRANVLYMDHANGGAELFPDVLRTLSTLADRGLVLALLTNGPSDGQRTKLEATGLLKVFEHIFISEEIGAAKPSIQAFQRVAGYLGLSVSDCLMVGDALDIDVRGAQAAGMEAMLLARSGDAERDEWTISTLDDLPAKLAPTGQRRGR